MPASPAPAVVDHSPTHVAAATFSYRFSSELTSTGLGVPGFQPAQTFTLSSECFVFILQLAEVGIAASHVFCWNNLLSVSIAHQSLPHQLALAISPVHCSCSYDRTADTGGAAPLAVSGPRRACARSGWAWAHGVHGTRLALLRLKYEREHSGCLAGNRCDIPAQWAKRYGPNFKYCSLVT